MDTESRVAVIGIVVDQTGDTEELNKVLHQYGQYIVGRMGIPYHKRNAAWDFFEGAVFEGAGSTGMKTR